MISIDLDRLQPHTWRTIPLLLLPFLLLYVQAFLLLKYGNQALQRLIRAAILPAGALSIGNAWLKYRVMTPEYNVFNFAGGCAAVFYSVLLVSYSLIPTGPSRTPSHSPALDALHLITSSRLVGWSSGIPRQPNPYTTLPREEAENKIRRDHAKMMVYHYLWTDATIYAFHLFGREGLGLPSGGSIERAAVGWIGMLERWGWVGKGFASANGWGNLALKVGFKWWVGGAMGFAFYQALCLGWHAIAFCGMTFFKIPSEEFPRLMNQPWRSTSLLDFWGKRWHQIFRQAFTAPTRFVPKKYRSLAAPFFAFFISAAMHELGTLTLVGHTSPNWKVAKSFIAMAGGMTCEILFRRITGRRVKGPLGWVWTWLYFTTATMGLVESWLGMGIGGAKLIPTTISMAHYIGNSEAAGKVGVWVRRHMDGTG